MQHLPLPAPDSDDGGRVALRLPRGRYEATLFKEGFGRTRVTFELPPQTPELEVVLALERRVRVHVRERASGQPVAGATVRAFQGGQEYGVPHSVTDEGGETELRGLHPDDDLQVSAVPPGLEIEFTTFGPSFQPRRHPLPAGARDLTLHIDLPHVVSWEVGPGDIPVPPDGTVIPITKQPGTTLVPPPRGVIVGGRLVAAGWPPGAALGLAHGPQDTVARLWARKEATQGNPITFRRATTVEVVLRSADGAPVAGRRVGLVNQGNNLIQEAQTDERGVARLERLEGRLAELYVMGSHRFDRRLLMGTVDLRRGGVQRIEYTLPREREVEVTVTVDGKPGLPPNFHLTVGNRALQDPEADEEGGTIHGTVVLPHSDSIGVSLTAPGYRRVFAMIRVPDGDAPLRHRFTLERGLKCRVRLVGWPEGREHRRLSSLELQRRAGEGWFTVDSPNRFPRLAREETEDGWVYRGLEPGRYRIRAQGTGVVFDSVEVREGAPAPLLVADLSRAALVSGRIEVPDGFDFKGAGVVLSGEGIEPDRTRWRQLGTRVRPDGAFESSVPGDRPVRLTATHPLLGPDPAEGHLDTTEGRAGVVLRLVPQATLRFRVPDHFRKYAEMYRKYPRAQRPLVEVRLYAGEPSATPVFRRSTFPKEEEWVVGGIRPGTYGVWIDVPEGVPFYREGVKLERGDNDLGDLPVQPGSRVNVLVKVQEPFAVPRISAWAQRLDEPTYSRSVNSGGEAEVVVVGLAAGRYRVMGGPIMAHGRRRLDAVVEVDGVRDAELVLDLR
ncbi:MAG: hypothetical protein ACE5JG_07345 [Planctomycetota bacterium]